MFEVFGKFFRPRPQATPAKLPRTASIKPCSSGRMLRLFLLVAYSTDGRRFLALRGLLRLLAVR
ncbi:MAG TPA: hypothetical protein VKJ65_10395, partial [Phycisphaerae bacterium]|nr:hypothetical protein [Phycisphaerae bacterium]